MIQKLVRQRKTKPIKKTPTPTPEKEIKKKHATEPKVTGQKQKVTKKTQTLKI